MFETMNLEKMMQQGLSKHLTITRRRPLNGRRYDLW